MHGAHYSFCVFLKQKKKIIFFFLHPGGGGSRPPPLNPPKSATAQLPKSNGFNEQAQMSPTQRLLADTIEPLYRTNWRCSELASIIYSRVHSDESNMRDADARCNSKHHVRVQSKYTRDKILREEIEDRRVLPLLVYVQYCEHLFLCVCVGGGGSLPENCLSDLASSFCLSVRPSGVNIAYSFKIVPLKPYHFTVLSKFVGAVLT